MQERCDMKEIQKMLGSFSCPELAELSALATKYKMNFADLGINDIEIFIQNENILL